MEGRFRALSLVIPAYNEAAGIREAVAEADEALARLADDYEVLIVDDGSRDGTADVVREEMARRPRVRLLRHESNRGYGAALRTGFEAARFDRVAFTDADCQFHLDDLAPLLRLAETHPIAVGHRVDRQDPWLRRFYSRGYNTLVRALLGTRVRDCDCALKVFHREALRRLLPESRGFFVNTEMLTRARQLGLPVAEAGVRHRSRLRGRSTVSPAQVPRILAVLLPFWWSRVLFPLATNGRSPAARSVLPACLVFLAAAVLFFSSLGCALLEPQEARYAEVPRQMFEGARAGWLTPMLHGQPYYDKPPLLYWLVLLSYGTFGVHDWAARLVPGLAGCLTVLVTYLWGRRAVGERAAVAGALMLCLSARFVYLGRMLTFDILLALFVTASLAAAHTAMTARGGRLHRGWWILSAAACGLGLLTKGPVALALVAMPLMAFAALDRRIARPGVIAWCAFAGVALAVAAPWFVLTALSEPEFAEYFFWRHNVVRFVAPFDHAEPVWFYLPGVFLGMLPWALLLPGLGRFLLRHSRRVAARRPAALGFFLLCALWGLLFFSLAGCKRAVYVLPVFPPLALALGCYLDCILPRWRTAGRTQWVPLLLPRRGSALARPATMLVLALAAGGGLLGVAVGMLPVLHGLGVAAGALAALAPLWRKREAPLSWAACAGTTFVLLFVGVLVGLPAYNKRFALRGCVLAQSGAGTDRAVAVACYPQGWDSVSFYLRRDDVRIYSREQRGRLIADLHRAPETLLFVKTDRAGKELLRQLPASVEFEPRGKQADVIVGRVRPLKEEEFLAKTQRAQRRKTEE